MFLKSHDNPKSSCQQDKFIDIPTCISVMDRCILPFLSLPTDRCLEHVRMTFRRRVKEQWWYHFVHCMSSLIFPSYCQVSLKVKSSCFFHSFLFLLKVGGKITVDKLYLHFEYMFLLC